MTLRDDIIQAQMLLRPFDETADRILDLIRQQRQQITEAVIAGWRTEPGERQGVWRSQRAADAVIELLCGDDGKAETIHHRPADQSRS